MRNVLQNSENCPRCYVGRIKLQKITLSTVVSGQVLSVPGFPAWKCDICGAFMFDPKAMLELHEMLKPPKPVRAVKKSSVQLPKKAIHKQVKEVVNSGSR